jgi:hypothetical protein
MGGQAAYRIARRRYEARHLGRADPQRYVTLAAKRPR